MRYLLRGGIHHFEQREKAQSYDHNSSRADNNVRHDTGQLHCALHCLGRGNSKPSCDQVPFCPPPLFFQRGLSRANTFFYRAVEVTTVNRCLITEGKCRHTCHPYAQCVFTDPGFVCECRKGFDKVIDPQTGEEVCKDNTPPVIVLKGTDPVILRACR